MTTEGVCALRVQGEGGASGSPSLDEPPYSFNMELITDAKCVPDTVLGAEERNNQDVFLTDLYLLRISGR